MPPVAPPVTTPMIHYHFLIVKTHQHGRLYQHHLFRFTPKVRPNEKMAPPSRAKGGAMTPVALPPAVASAQNIHLPERALRKPTRKNGPPQNETMLPNGALNNIQLPGHVVRTTGTGPTEAHQDGSPPKRNYCQSGSTTTSNIRSGPHLGCQDGPLPNRNCFRNGPTTLNYTGAGPC